ncbi:MAG: glutamate decarboxylase [Ruminococcaceae bacterium]|nr:glutamate decarboxylase [Oscillospiraceae bacterium]
MTEMWTVVHLTQEETAARSLALALERNNLLSRVRPVSRQEGETSYEVLVPETEVSAALEVIIDIGL